MRLKFHLLPDGQPFTWRGKRLIKSGPVTANDEAGKQQMVPRSALVAPEADPGDDGSDTLDNPHQRLSIARAALQSGLHERLESSLSGRLTPLELSALKAEFAQLLDQFFKDAGLEQSRE